MARNDNVASRLISQRFSSSDVKNAFNEVKNIIAREAGVTVSEVNKTLDNMKIGDNIVNKIVAEFERAEKELGGKSFTFSKDLFKGVIDSKGVEEEIDKVIKTFSNKIEAIINLRDRIGNDQIFANVITNMDTKQLDDVIEKTRQLIELEKERDTLTGKDKARITRQRNALDKELNASVGQIKIDFDVDSGKINEANKALEKYNVSQDEALKKAKELSKQRNVASSYIDKDNINDVKDMIAYMQRYIELVKQAGGTEDEALKKLRSEVGPANVLRLTGASGDTGYSDYKDEIQNIRTEIATLNQEARGIGGQVFDDSKLKEQEQEINKLTESLEKTQAELDNMSQKYKEQTDLVSELRKQTQALEGVNDPKVLESDEYKKLTEELKIAESRASAFQNELAFAEETAERLRGSLNAYNTGDVVPRKDLENASSLIDLLDNKINKLKTSLIEAEQRAESLSGQMNALQQDNTSLNEQLSQQKQINEKQKEQISNLEKMKSELEGYKNQYKELLNTINEVESAQQRAMSLADNAGRIEAFNSATRNVNYNEGIDAPESFVNFDYLDKAKQKLEETGDKYEKLIKAAVYYNQYLEKGGTEKIFNADGKDISEQLISTYKEMSNMAKENGEISQQSAIQTVKDLNNELIALRSKSSELEENCKKLEKQLKLQKEISKQSAQIKTKTETTTESSNADVMSKEELRQQMMKDQEKKRKQTQSVTPQVDQSSITSEQQTLEKLEQAIRTVTATIAEKTKAIQAEEVQMDLSVNNEIAKLQELESKLTEIKTQFQNGILSKNPDGGDNVTLEKDVNLKPTLDAAKFKKDTETLLAFVDVDKEVELKIKGLDSDSIKSATADTSASDNALNNNVIEEQNKDIEHQEFLYNNIIRLLTEYLSLQDKISAGNRRIVQSSNTTSGYENISDLVNSSDIRRKQGTNNRATTKSSIQRELKNYLNLLNNDSINTKQIDRAKEELAAYVYSYKDLEGAAEIFGEKNKEAFNEIVQMIEKAKVSLKSYEDAQMSLRAARNNIFYLSDKNSMTFGQADQFEGILKTEGLDSALKYITDELDIKIPEAADKTKAALNDVEAGVKDVKDGEKGKDNLLSLDVHPEINQQEWFDEIDDIIDAIRTRVNPFKLDLDIDNWITVIENKLTEISGKKVKLDVDTTLLPSNDTDSNTSSQEERHAKEVAEAQKKYEEQLLAEKKQREKEYTAWWTSELNNRDQIQKQIQAEEARYQKELDKQLEKENAALNKSQIDKFNQFMAEDKNQDTKTQTEEYKKLESAVVEYGNLQEKIAKSNNEATQEQINKLKELENTINSISKGISEKGLYSVSKEQNIAGKLLKSDSNVVDISSAVENAKNSLNSLKNDFNTDILKQVFSEAEVALNNLNNEFAETNMTLPQYKKNVDAIINSLSKKQNVVGVFDKNNILEAQQAMTTYAMTVRNVEQSSIKWNKAGNQLTATFTDQNKQLRTLILNAKVAEGQFSETFGSPVKKISSFSKFLDELNAKFRNLATYLLSFVGFYEIWGAIRQGVTYVRELDTALTEMRKVSDETTQSLREFQEASFDIADSVGATAQVVQNSTAEWMRLGESLEQAAESAQVSNILLNVSEFENIDDATESLVAMSQAYQEFDKIDIVDKLNNIGM